MSAAIAGYFLILSLILAIGAQNAFVLRQGLRQSHVFAVCLFCSVVDAVLITFGVLGFAALADSAPWFETLMRYGGALFLIVYGGLNARSAWRGGSALNIEGEAQESLSKVMAATAAVTLLNPHMYLDTVVLVGSVSAQYDQKTAFATGAALASFSFFFALGYGARFLRPLFQNPKAWQILDAGIALIMWTIAAALLLH